MQTIKDGGYATDLSYVDKLCNLIERFNLTQYDIGPATDSTESASAPALPYPVKVSIPNLNIRKGPGTNYGKTGKFTGIGVFTIVEEADGQGASKWGLLKSYAGKRNGWISLDYANRL